MVNVAKIKIFIGVNVEKSKGEFKGTTEIDEAYLGDKEGNMHKNKKANAEKAVILGMINRDTKQTKAFRVASGEKENLLPKINIDNARGVQ